jgi:hypothetical protein
MGTIYDERDATNVVRWRRLAIEQSGDLCGEDSNV